MAATTPIPPARPSPEVGGRGARVETAVTPSPRRSRAPLYSGLALVLVVGGVLAAPALLNAVRGSAAVVDVPPVETEAEFSDRAPIDFDALRDSLERERLAAVASADSVARADSTAGADSTARAETAAGAVATARANALARAARRAAVVAPRTNSPAPAPATAPATTPATAPARVAPRFRVLKDGTREFIPPAAAAGAAARRRP